MTEDENRARAIEAAIKECRRCLVKDCGQLEDAVPLAIEAYEAAMWTKEEPSKDGTRYLIDLDGEATVVGKWLEAKAEDNDADDGRAAWRSCWDHADLRQGYHISAFRPLPKPPEKG